MLTTKEVNKERVRQKLHEITLLKKRILIKLNLEKLIYITPTVYK